MSGGVRKERRQCPDWHSSILRMLWNGHLAAQPQPALLWPQKLLASRLSACQLLSWSTSSAAATASDVDGRDVPGGASSPPLLCHHIITAS